MSGIDTEVFNLLERAESTDVNNAQSLIARFFSDLFRHALAKRAMTSGETTVSAVFGGLLLTPSGGDVIVSAGMMGQLSLTLAPVPGPLDSPYRLSRLENAVTITMPTPVSTTHYLIEAKMVEVITDTQSRDIFDPVTKTFTPSTVTKQTERQIQFQTVAGGSSAPAPSGGDWVPIAVVRRPPGGPAITTADIWDVRPLASFAEQLPNAPARIKRSIQTLNTVSNNVDVQAVFTGFNGSRTVETFTPVDVTSATFLSPGTILTASTRFYLYLAPYALNLSPKQVGASLLTKGVLVLSSVAPTRDGWNSASLALPAPWTTVPANAFTAYYVGTLVRNGSNTGWVRMVATDGDVALCEGDLGPTALALAPIPASQAVPLSIVPVTARKVVLSMLMSGVGGAGAPNPIGLSIRPTGVAVDFSTVFVNTDDVDYRTLQAASDGSGSVDFRCTGTPGLVASLNILQSGWSE